MSRTAFSRTHALESAAPCSVGLAVDNLVASASHGPMHLAELKQRLRALAGPDLEARLTELERELGHTDPDLLLAELRARRLISTTLYTELAAGSPIEVGRSNTASTASSTSSSHALLGVLGRGAMGEVLVAKDLQLRRRVAYKRMVPEVQDNERLAARFFEEVQVTAQLDHPNIVPIYGLEVGEDGSLGYSMKLVQGSTLAELLEEAAKTVASRSPAEEAGRLATHLDDFLKVCDGIAYAHSKRVLHRDLKPENIMIGRYHEVYVMDWGICRVIGSHDSAEDHLMEPAAGSQDPRGRTQYGAVMGTPAYLSPEQALGKNPELDERSDLYTLGLILQEVVTLRRAVSGDNVMVLLAKAAQGERDPVVHLQPGLPIAPELKAIMARATAPRPEARYASVAEFAADLRRYKRGEAVLAKPDTPLEAAVRWIGQHRAMALATMLGLLLAGAGATIGVLLWGRHQLERAHDHELALGQFLGQAARRSHVLDNQFHRYEAALAHLAGRATQLLTDPEPPGTDYYLTSAFDAGRRPPDTLYSEYDQLPVSVGWPTIQLAPGVTLEGPNVEREARTLSLLGPVFRALLLTSRGEVPEKLPAPRARRLLLDERAPIARAFVTLADGVHSTYPGAGNLPADFDGRQRPKYKLAEGKYGVRWGNPYLDRRGHGLLLPSAVALYDEEGRFLGVAGFDLTFQFIREKLLTQPDVPAVEETYLVDEAGQVVVHSGPGGAAPFDAEGGDPASVHSGAAVKLRLLGYPPVVTAIRERRTGHVELAKERKVVAYCPLESLGWYYVVVANTAVLFARPAAP